jgi:hypothetical protein
VSHHTRHLENRSASPKKFARELLATGIPDEDSAAYAPLPIVVKGHIAKHTRALGQLNVRACLCALAQSPAP